MIMTDIHLLSDERVQHFLAHGCLTLQTTLDAEFHRSMWTRLEALTDGDVQRRPGNNLLPVVPALNDVLDDPTVRGALTSLLGSGYALHPHRAVHINAPGSKEQDFHIDNYWGYRVRVRNHRPRWAMLMYFPQDTPIELGPTAVIPGSQYQTRRPSADTQSMPGVVRAGECLLIHYDLWHRKMKNLSMQNRYMVKFQFMRMHEPTGPTWNHISPVWRLIEMPTYDMSTVWRRHWQWLLNSHELPPQPAAQAVYVADSGCQCESARLRDANGFALKSSFSEQDVARISALLEDVSDPVTIVAAYALASTGRIGIPPLLESIRRNDGPHVAESGSASRPLDYIPNGERVARAATYGLVEIGQDAVAGLLDVLRAAQPRGRKLAAFALGEINCDEPEVTHTLARAAADSEHSVRLNVVDALGLKRPSGCAVEALISGLQDPEADVRFGAALALARFGPGAESAVPALSAALRDTNRYVVGHAIEALSRIGTAEARNVLLPFLKAARWCPQTTPASPF